MLYVLQDIDTKELKTVTVEEGIALVNENNEFLEGWQKYTRCDWMEGLSGLYIIHDLIHENM